MAEIKLRFMRGRGLSSLAIAFWEFRHWSHVDLIVKEGLLGAREMGVKIRPFDYAEGDFAIGTIECTEVQAQTWEGFCRRQIGTGYDFLAILGFPLHIDLSLKNTWICSSLQAAAGIYSHAMPFSVERLNRITPGEIADRLQLRPVPKGQYIC
jgi:hypothetical protein